MVFTSLIRRQLKIFAVLATVAVGLVFYRYAQVPTQLGVGVHDISVEFDDASGLYPQALVTYRGVEVGRVTDLDVSPQGAVATLRLKDDVRIPADASAELHSTSAVGEQYIDLLAPDGAGPYLTDGSTIGRDRSVEMPQITPALDSLNRLLAAVPRAETRRALDQVAEGYAGAERDLGGVVEGMESFLTEAHARVDATTSLIHAARPVLETQRALGPNTVDYASALAKLTSSLSENESAEIRALLERGPGGLAELTRLVNGMQPVLPMLLANLTTNADVLNTYLPELKQLLVVYPATAHRLQPAVNSRAAEGDVALDLRIGPSRPGPCREGYLPPSQRRFPHDETTRDVDLLAHCKTAPDDPAAIRGARNLPCPHSPARGPVPAACGLRFGDGVWPDREGTTAARDVLLGAGDDNALTLSSVEESELWKILVLAPLRMGVE